METSFLKSNHTYIYYYDGEKCVYLSCVRKLGFAKSSCNYYTYTYKCDLCTCFIVTCKLQ